MLTASPEQHASPKLASPFGRNSALDVLRAFAIILVFCRHASIPPFSMIGWAGVDLFFVLSGFLVSGLLFREYQEFRYIKPGRFLARRGFKIYPQFYLLVLVTALTYFAAGKPIPASQVAADVFFLQSYFSGFWGHAWSLAVEEHFYLLLSVTLALLARRGGHNPFRPLTKWIPAVFLVELLIRIANYFHDPVWTYASKLYPTHLRMDSLLAGVLLSYFYSFHGPRLGAFVDRYRAWIAGASCVLLCPFWVLPQGDPFVFTVGFSMLWVAFALLLMITIYPKKSQKPPGSASRALAAIGRVSYAFYLWHLPMLALGDWAEDKYFPFSVPMVFIEPLVAFAVTMALAFLTTRLVETPFLRLRDRLIPSRVRSALVESSAPIGV